MRDTSTAAGSVLVGRRIQTPSVATVLSAEKPVGEIVLGALPPGPPLSVAGDPLAEGDCPPGSIRSLY